MSDDTTAKIVVDGDLDPLKKALSQGAVMFQEASAKMELSMKSVGNSIKAVQGYFVAFTAILAGGAAFKAVIGASNEWAGDSGKLAKALGISAAQASILKVAMQHAGIESDVMVTASQKLSKQIFSNGAAFETMGIKTKDSSGNYRPVLDVMTEANQKLGQIKNPIAQNIAGMQLYGKAWAEVKPLMKLTSDAMKEAETRARELGLVVGDEDVEAAKKYKAQLRDLDLVNKSIAIQVGKELTPAFVKLGSVMADVGPSAGRAFGASLQWLGQVAATVWVAFEQTGDAIAALGAKMSIFADAWNGSGNLSPSAFVDRMKGAFAKMDDVNAQREQHQKESRDRIARIWADIPAPKTSKEPETKGGPNPDFAKGANAKETLMARLSAELEEMKLKNTEKANAEGHFYEMSKEEERKYWQDRYALAAAGSKDQLAIRQKIAALGVGIQKDAYEAELARYRADEVAAGHNLQKKLEIAKQETAKISEMYQGKGKELEQARAHELEIEKEITAQKLALAQELESRKRMLQQMDIDAAQQDAQFQEQLGIITKAQLIQQEQQFAAQRFEIERQAVEAEEELIKGTTKDPVALEKLETKLLEIKRKYALQAGQLTNQLAIEQQKPMLAVTATMEQSFAAATTQMLMRAQTLRQGLISIFKSIGQVFLSEMVTKPLAEFAIRIFKETALYKALSAFKISSLITDGAAEKAGAATEIATNELQAQSAAGLAAVNAMASVAAIPFYGWAMAPAVGAETYGIAEGFAATAAASGGYDIPAGINPVTQLHQEEMVLPAHLANAVRDMAGGGGAGQGGDIHMHVHTQSTQDFQNFLTQNSHVLAPAIRRLARNGVRT